MELAQIQNLARLNGSTKSGASSDVHHLDFTRLERARSAAQHLEQRLFRTWSWVDVRRPRTEGLPEIPHLHRAADVHVAPSTKPIVPSAIHAVDTRLISIVSAMVPNQIDI